MNDINSHSPYRPLGKYLKQLRTRANESLAEASGAVEIDVRQLANFELGKLRPSEDVLLLLISHFGAKDDEAVRMWEMAGYGLEKIPASHMGNNDVNLSVNNDSKILFTDIVDIVVNKYGVIMNFMQTGSVSKPNPVARVGMSREHARSVRKILDTTLSQIENNHQPQKQLNDKNQ